MAARKTRENLTAQVVIRLKPSQLRALDSYAKRRLLNRAEALREIVTLAFAEPAQPIVSTARAKKAASG